jgi:endo-1,4-beta-xylanase
MVACQPAPTATPAPTNAPLPTNTLLPTATPTLMNTPTATATPIATATATLTAETRLKQWAESGTMTDAEKKTFTDARAAYVKAFGIDQNSINTAPIEIKDKGGKVIAYAVVDDKTGVPLLVSGVNKEGKNVWVEATLANAKPDNIRIASTGNSNLETILTHFGNFTGNYAFHWINSNPSEGVMRFDRVTNEMKLADRIGNKYQALHLVWGSKNALPDWLKNKINTGLTNDQLLSMIRNHVKEIVQFTKGKVATYSVVNEIFGSDTTPNNLFSKLYPTDEQAVDFIGEMLRIVRNEGSAAKLIINDTGIEFGGTKSDRIFNIVKKLKEKGAPIDGIGFQMHLIAARLTDADFTRLEEQIKRYNAIGVEVSFTEIDVDMNDRKAEPTQKLIEQADIYRKVMEVGLKNGVTDFTFMSGNDESSWLIPSKPNAMPTLFSNNNPKRAYYSVLGELIKSR